MNLRNIVTLKGEHMELFFSLLILLPYIEISKVRSLLTFFFDDFHFIPSIIIILIIIMVTLLPLLIMRPAKKSSRAVKSYFIRIFCTRLIFDSLVLIRIIFSTQPISILSQYIWNAVPFYFALFIVYVIHRLNLDISRFHINAIFIFTFYLIVNIIINIVIYQFSFGITEFGESSRLISPGGGPVIFGYTIAIMFALLLFYKNKITGFKFLVICFIMVIASFFTGSRGSMWPITLLLTIYLIEDKRKMGIAVLFLLAVSALYINPVEFLKSNIPRFFNLLDDGRILTLLNSIEIYSRQPLFRILFGTGLGVFFPYQKWYLYRTPGINYFLYDGMTMLVQPHNSYIYLLLETGIIGVILFFYPAYKAIMLFPRLKYTKNIKYAFFTIVLITLLNLFDSVFITAPGSATLWWLILLSLTLYLYEYKIFTKEND